MYDGIRWYSKTFGSKTINMIEAKPVNIDYLLGREWELPQINKLKWEQSVNTFIASIKIIQTLLPYLIF